MIRCSFCEQFLTCKECGKPFRPDREEFHAGIYRPDLAVSCPECQKDLVCKFCGFSYGGDEVDEPTSSS